MLSHLIALTLAIVIDRLIGDPKRLPHPVVGIGKLISYFEKRLNLGNYKKIKGIIMLSLVLLIIVSVTYIGVTIAYDFNHYIGITIEALLISATIASKSLEEAAIDVAKPLQQGDLKTARIKLGWIVGRDTEQLSEPEIVRGTVETVAENTSDGVTAPLLFALVGGAPLAFFYRVINTCDSMVGYKNERFGEFGWASARMDDLVNWLPSRITGMLMLISHKPNKFLSRKECFILVVKDAKKHPSPNSGWGEAAVAALIGVQLGGRNTYKGIISDRAKMGIANKQLETLDIFRAIKIMKMTVILFTLWLWCIGGIYFVVT